MRVHEAPVLGWGALAHLAGAVPDVVPVLGDASVPTGSGRAALRIILEHLSATGVLRDRNDALLVPRWICQSVLHTAHRFSHPVLEPSPGVRAVLAYHQYGFPQDMDAVSARCSAEGLYLIEDCANVFGGTYRGRPLGTIGDAAIFSFPKLFPSLLGGALVSSDEALLERARSRCEASRRPIAGCLARWLWEVGHGSGPARRTRELGEMTYGTIDDRARPPKIALRAVAQAVRAGAIEARKRNYRAIRDRFADRPEYLEGLEVDAVPYIVPLFAPEDDLRRMESALRAAGVVTGVYHFDVARNVFEPRFVKCLWLPVHQGLDVDEVERICDVAAGAVR
ncbi:MAG: hypothetical protein FDZ70_00220 [Actinobacteria bacterium]|nr:MAG: hypothetical protein FDZ70_00220 [Actinomycetota bacterium]